jgi:hypothetical protein
MESKLNRQTDARSQAIDDCIKVVREDIAAAGTKFHCTPSDALVDLRVARSELDALKRVFARLEALKNPSPPTSSGGKDG